MIEQMKMMKTTLMNCVQGQMGDLTSVDAKELGEAVDMIKDLSEAIYYCTITESMERATRKKKSITQQITIEIWINHMVICTILIHTEFLTHRLICLLERKELAITQQKLETIAKVVVL